jgi:hypothetical protein
MRRRAPRPHRTSSKPVRTGSIKKGYSTDYIEQKIGKRQPGLASEWRGNASVSHVQTGDAILIRLPVPGAQHAALAEEVRRNADGTVTEIRLSEWNWAKRPTSAA